MKSLNNAQVIGNLTREPEMKFTEGGTAICKFSVATNRTWTKDGEKQEAADFHNVVTWGKLAEICAQILHKGERAYIQGRMETQKYENKEGQTRYNFQIVADNVIALSSKRPEASPQDSGTAGSPGTDQVEEVEDVSDDIPF